MSKPVLGDRICYRTSIELIIVSYQKCFTSTKAPLLCLSVCLFTKYHARLWTGFDDIYGSINDVTRTDGLVLM